MSIAEFETLRSCIDITEHHIELLRNPDIGQSQVFVFINPLRKPQALTFIDNPATLTLYQSIVAMDIIPHIPQIVVLYLNNADKSR
jgi:hypothetical protein